MAGDLVPIRPEPEPRLPVDLTYEEQIVLEFCREGKGRNEIASLTGVSTWKVSQIASRHGHYFGRSPQVIAAQAARDAQLKERKQRLALQLLDSAELYADALSGVGSPKDGQLVAKALRDIIESHDLLTNGVPEGNSLEDAKDFLRDFHRSLGYARDEFERQYGVPFESDEAKQILEQLEQQAEENRNEQPGFQ